MGGDERAKQGDSSHESNVQAACCSISIAALKPVEKTFEKEWICYTETIREKFDGAEKQVATPSMGGEQTTVQFKADALPVLNGVKPNSVSRRWLAAGTFNGAGSGDISSNCKIRGSHTAAAQRASTSNKLDALMQGHFAYLEQPMARLGDERLAPAEKNFDRCDGRKSADSSAR